MTQSKRKPNSVIAAAFRMPRTAFEWAILIVGFIIAAGGIRETIRNHQNTVDLPAQIPADLRIQEGDFAEFVPGDMNYANSARIERRAIIGEDLQTGLTTLSVMYLDEEENILFYGRFVQGIRYTIDGEILRLQFRWEGCSFEKPRCEAIIPHFDPE